MKVTIFPSLTNTDNPQYQDVKTVLNLIQTGGKQKDFIERLRTLPPEQYKTEKRKLPIICFGAELSQRNKEGIIQGTGLCILDFDGLKEPKIIRAALEGDECVYSVFMSPSGENGLKALVRIPKVNTDDEYKKYWAALKKKYPDVDQSGKDIVRSCFFSYDPEIYINDKAKVWDVRHETPKEKKQDSPYQVKDGAWNNIHTALRKIEDSIEGEKHDVRTRVAYLFGGWVGSKQLRYDDALKLLEGAVSKNTTDLKAAMKDIKDCLNAGMNKPLTMNQEREVLNMKVGLGRKYVPMAEVIDKVVDFYENGYQRGYDVGWKCAVEYISILKGSTSYIYGAPFSGKSQWWHEVLVNIISKLEESGTDEYAMILSPETGSVEQIYGELISIKARRSFIGDFKMPKEEMNVAADFISRHFLVMDFDGENATMKDVFTQVESAEREFGIKIGFVTIDPLNYLVTDEQSFSRRDLAISKDLDYMLADARKNNRHNTIITHAANQQIQKTKDGQWYYPVVSAREVLDGQQFFRKGMIMISVYRPLDIKGMPLFSEDGVPYEENETHIYIQKAKPKGSSKIGNFKLFYDFKKNSYYEVNDFTGGKMYAFDHEKIAEKKTEGNLIKQNTDFDKQLVEEDEELDAPF